MKAVFAGIVLLALFLAVPGLGSRDFWAPDEGDFAQIARELRDDLLVPRLNGQVYAEKPPLFYYTIALSQRLFGGLGDEWALRLPSALAAALFVLFFLWSAAIRLGKDEAVLASLVLVASPLFYWQARYLQVDMLFGVLCCSSFFSLLWFVTEGRQRWLYIGVVFLALASLTKGPLAPVLVLPPFLILAVIERRTLGLTASSFLGGMALYLLLVLPWYLAIYLREGGVFLYENVVRQNFTRFFEAWSHKRPFYYYLTTLPLDFFPWSLFLPLGLARGFRKALADRRWLLLLLSVSWSFLFLSLSSGKISKYMLPLLPALSLFTALAFKGPATTYHRIVALFLTCLFAALSATAFFVRLPLPVPLGPERVAIGAICLFTAAAILLCGRKAAPILFAIILTAGTAIYTVGNLSLLGTFNTVKSPKRLAAMVREATDDGTPWVYYGSMRGVYVYYTGRRAIHVGEHDVQGLTRVSGEHPSLVILSRKRDLQEVMGAIPDARVVAEAKVGDTPMVLIRSGFPR